MSGSKTIIWGLVFLLSTGIKAQEIIITGIVKEGVSKLVLQDAVVTIKYLDTVHFKHTFLSYPLKKKRWPIF